MRDFFTIGSPIRMEKVKPILTGWSFRYFYELNETKFSRQYFLYEKARKELILGHEKYEKLENSNGLQVPKVEPFQ